MQTIVELGLSLPSAQCTESRRCILTDANTNHYEPLWCLWDIKYTVNITIFLKCTWREAYQGAVGQGVVSIHFKVDRDGVQNSLQVLLLFKTTG